MSFVTFYSDELMENTQTIVNQGEDLTNLYSKSNSFISFYNTDKSHFYYDFVIREKGGEESSLSQQGYSLTVKSLYFCYIHFQDNALFTKDTLACSYPNYWVRIKLNTQVAEANRDLIFEFWLERNNTIK